MKNLGTALSVIGLIVMTYCYIKGFRFEIGLFIVSIGLLVYSFSDRKEKQIENQTQNKS